MVVPGPDEGPGGGERLQGRDVNVAHVQVHLLFYRIGKFSVFNTVAFLKECGGKHMAGTWRQVENILV